MQEWNFYARTGRKEGEDKVDNCSRVFVTLFVEENFLMKKALA
jgi:hypothetical protein